MLRSEFDVNVAVIAARHSVASWRNTLPTPIGTPWPAATTRLNGKSAWLKKENGRGAAAGGCFSALLHLFFSRIFLLLLCRLLIAIVSFQWQKNCGQHHSQGGATRRAVGTRKFSTPGSVHLNVCETIDVGRCKQPHLKPLICNGF